MQTISGNKISAIVYFASLDSIKLKLLKLMNDANVQNVESFNELLELEIICRVVKP